MDEEFKKQVSKQTNKQNKNNKKPCSVDLLNPEINFSYFLFILTMLTEYRPPNNKALTRTAEPSPLMTKMILLAHQCAQPYITQIPQFFPSHIKLRHRTTSRDGRAGK